MRALVTGASGLIGNNLTKELLLKGFSVKAFVRSTSNLQSLPGNIELCYGDMLDVESLKSAATGCDIIFHTAGMFAYWGYNTQQFIGEAKQGMENIIIAAAYNKVKRIVFTSSSVTVGATEKQKCSLNLLPGILRMHRDMLLPSCNRNKQRFQKEMNWVLK